MHFTIYFKYAIPYVIQVLKLQYMKSIHVFLSHDDDVSNILRWIYGFGFRYSYCLSVLATI